MHSECKATCSAYLETGASASGTTLAAHKALARVGCANGLNRVADLCAENCLALRKVGGPAKKKWRECSSLWTEH